MQWQNDWAYGLLRKKESDMMRANFKIEGEICEEEDIGYHIIGERTSDIYRSKKKH